MLGRERYAVVSCHVERPLDDRSWELFSRIQEEAPHGFRIAALLRPPDESAGEEAGPWLERARTAAALGPFGHHTHWGGPEQARPQGGNPAERVRRETHWLRAHGFEPGFFCGGGWYLDREVVAALAEAGYSDCTGTAFQPRYLGASAPRLGASEPCWLELSDGRRVLELPTTHSLGMLLRALVRPRALREPLVHAYFHDGDLLDPRRRILLQLGLALLARRRVPSDLGRVADRARGEDLPVSRAFSR